MDPPKTFPYTDEELDAAGLLGESKSLGHLRVYPTLTISLEDVSENVVQTIKLMREHPELLNLSLFTLECMNDSGHRKSPSSPAPPTFGEASFYPSGVTIASDATAVAPYALSDWERITYYSGISPDPPELLYRSDLLENPFPIPKGRPPYIPTKTIHGVFYTPLSAVWDTVGPQISEFLKARNIRYSTISTVRFITHGEDGNNTRGPVVIWIATHPTSTTPENAHDASPGILALLEAKGVEGAVVEWYEGVVERL